MIHLCLDEGEYFLLDDISNAESFYCDDLVELVKDCLNNNFNMHFSSYITSQQNSAIAKYNTIKDFVQYYLDLQPEEFV